MTKPSTRTGSPAHALQALRAIVMREVLKFVQQRGRLLSALVRPVLCSAAFAAGFRNVSGVAIGETYNTCIPYDAYIVSGLMGMVLLFDGMQSSLAMVSDREMGLMRLLLTAPLPRWWLLCAKLSANLRVKLRVKLCATAWLNVLQVLTFVIVAALIGTSLLTAPLWLLHGAVDTLAGTLMMVALGLLLSVYVKHLKTLQAP